MALSVDSYVRFEDMIINSMTVDSGTITSPLLEKAYIEILSVEEGLYYGEYKVRFKIHNIQKERGCLYLSCTAHAYITQKFFFDDLHENEYREDGIYEYTFNFHNHEDGVDAMRIVYGYGKFDTSEGWTNKCAATISYLQVEDYGVIGSNTIPEEEIYPLYYNGEYVGAWTTHDSGDLIEVGSNSEAGPFEKHNVFVSDSGHTVSVEISSGTPIFFFDGINVGAPTSTMENDGKMYYDLKYDRYIMVIRYPNDEYIRVSNADNLLGETEACLYAQQERIQ